MKTLALLFALTSADASRVLATFYGAFNAHDSAAFVAAASEDVVWMSINGDKLIVDTAGREALRDAMDDYFRATPAVHSEFVITSVVGPYVTVRETVRWRTPAGVRTQTALGVYELQGGKVKKVWYFPAQH
jgi:hypothetical protein